MKKIKLEWLAKYLMPLYSITQYSKISIFLTFLLQWTANQILNNFVLELGDPFKNYSGGKCMYK